MNMPWEDNVDYENIGTSTGTTEDIVNLIYDTICEECYTTDDEEFKGKRCKNCVISKIKNDIKALEKHIPKKPIYETVGDYETGEAFYDSVLCPNCKKEINEYNGEYLYDVNTIPVCDHCGQRLDWSKNK